MRETTWRTKPCFRPYLSVILLELREGCDMSSRKLENEEKRFSFPAICDISKFRKELIRNLVAFAFPVGHKTKPFCTAASGRSA